LDYLGLHSALERGVLVTEVDEDGTVGEVRIMNPTNRPVLLFEGELISGGQQDRVIDQPVLVPAGAELAVPVSCVEQYRWDDGEGVARFRLGEHAADPALRSSKRHSAEQRAAAGQPPRPDQRLVWAEVSNRLAALEVESGSEALGDAFDGRRGAIDELREAIHPLPEQTGAIVRVHARTVAVDLTSRAEVFAELMPRLARGYALHTLAHQAAAYGTGADPLAPEATLLDVLHARRSQLPTLGQGRTFRLRSHAFVGCGLELDGELIALSAFPTRLTATRRAR
jgi:hypothetical protein